MTSTPQIPSRNPTNNDSMSGMFDVVLTKFLQGVDDMLPAQVVAFDRTTNLAQVQPLIPLVITNGQIVQRAPVQSIQVLQIGGGGFVLNFPIQPGDLGFIKANDRDISLFLQTFSTAIPNTARKHSFEDAIFVPTIMTGFTINSEDAANVVLQSLDGSVRVAVWSDRVKVTAPTVIIEAPTTTINCTTATINSTDTVINCTTTTVNGDAHITGTLQVDGNITSGSGGAAVDLLNHIHSNVTHGPDDSGPPVPGS